MTEQYELTVSKAELEELNGFVNLLDCSEKLKSKIHYLLGYVRLMSNAKQTKTIYDNLISDHSPDE